MLIRAALAAATERLGSIFDTPRLDAELLMAHVLGVERDALLLRQLDDECPPAFAPLLDRRLAHEPIAYITGRRAFWTIELEVGPGVLIPRPDSETLIEAAIAHFSAHAPLRILDLGTGSGALLLAALAQWPDATGVGVDVSEAALDIARGNAARLQMADRAQLRLGDWDKGFSERFDLILCNPPYVEEKAALSRDVVDWEPHGALFAGADGLDAYRILAPRIGRLLAREGIACFEIGAGQAGGASSLFQAEGLAAVVRPDLAGRPRCLVVSHL